MALVPYSYIDENGDLQTDYYDDPTLDTPIPEDTSSDGQGGGVVYVGDNAYFPTADGRFSVNGGSSTISAGDLKRLQEGDTSVNAEGTGTVFGSGNGIDGTTSSGLPSLQTDANQTQAEVDRLKRMNAGTSGIGNISPGSNVPTSVNTNSTDLLSSLQGAFKDKNGNYDAVKIAAALGGLGLLSKATGNWLGGNRQPAGFQGSIDMNRTFNRSQIGNPQTERGILEGGVMGRPYFTPGTYTVKAATGGLMPGDVGMAHGGRYLQGTTDGMADKLDTSIDGHQPAKLSHGEFVIPADVVSHLGNGNSDAGAQKLYQMMSRIRKARTGNPKQGKQINPDKFMPGGLAALATGGEVKGFADGGITTTTTPTGTTGTDSSLATWAGPMVTDLMSKGNALTNEPYTPYTGQLTAGASDLQNQAFGQMGNLPGYTPTTASYTPVSATNVSSTFQAPAAYTPGTFANAFTAPSAYQAGTFNTGTFDTAAAQKYMNPYLKQALDPQLAEMQRQNQITQMNNMKKFSDAGAFGGSRQAVYESENANNLMNKMQDVLGQGYNTAYNTAMSQFNTDQQRQLAAQQAAEQSRQFGAGQGMTAAQLQAQYGLSAQQAAEASRQFGANYGLQAATTAGDQALRAGLANQSANLQAGVANQNAGLQAANLTEQSRQFGANNELNNLKAMLDAGTTQRNITQQGLDAAKAQWDAAQADPYNKVKWGLGLFQGMPITAQTYTTPQPTLLDQLNSLGISGMALADLLNGKTTTPKA